MTSKKIKIIAGMLVLILLLFFALTARSNSQFRAVTISPSAGTLPTSSDTIVVEFNEKLKNLDEQPEGFISYSPEVRTKVSVNERTLTILLLDRPTTDEEFEVSFNNLMAENGDTLTTTIKYLVKYVPYNRLPEEEQQKQAASIGQPKDDNPLLSILPYDEIAFRVDYLTEPDTFGTAADWRAERNNYTVTITTYAISSGVSQEAYAKKTIAIRERALEWIRKLGVDPSKDINITYIPNDSILYDIDAPETNEPLSDPDFNYDDGGYTPGTEDPAP